MSKKQAIAILLLVEAAVYLFIFIGLPFLESLAGPTCTAREMFPSHPVLNSLPGVIGLLMLLGIWKYKFKKEVNDE